MKALGIWLALVAGSFGALAGGYHLYLSENPRRVAVVVDASFPMRDAWPRLDTALDRIQERRYAQFSLFTEKGRVHGWESRLKPGRIAPYAPRDLSRLEALAAEPEIDGADEALLITNAPTSETAAVHGFRIVRP